MKHYIFLLFFAFAAPLSAQKVNYNTSKDFVAKGYDVTEYFANKAIRGASNFIATHDGVKYKFATQENLEKFKSNPEKYIPQYGGFCAYAIGVNSEKVDINPKTFEIRDGKLYLFYNSWGINTLEKWLEEDPEKLLSQADVNWVKIKK
ncbi:YHS domain-containing (seleno)protein [Aquimarina pacifica]|uniref:YHS domain-containing (seleno)protein n=1 Tax=Aquimarina pacifica TaxID=1296415 RepID=UPI00046FE65A|nr:YHS domain-containing (seleno)protein [Aquimarina pacifica]